MKTVKLTICCFLKYENTVSPCHSNSFVFTNISVLKQYFRDNSVSVLYHLPSYHNLYEHHTYLWRVGVEQGVPGTHFHFPENFVDDAFLWMVMFTGVYLENEGLYHFIARAMPFAFSAPLPFKKSRQVLNQILLLLARPKIFCFIQNNI